MAPTLKAGYGFFNGTEVFVQELFNDFKLRSQYAWEVLGEDSDGKEKWLYRADLCIINNPPPPQIKPDPIPIWIGTNWISMSDGSQIPNNDAPTEGPTRQEQEEHEQFLARLQNSPIHSA